MSSSVTIWGFGILGTAKYESKLDGRWVGMLRERRGERLITDAMPGMIVIGLNELFDEKLKNKKSSDFLRYRFTDLS